MKNLNFVILVVSLLSQATLPIVVAWSPTKHTFREGVDVAQRLRSGNEESIARRNLVARRTIFQSIWYTTTSTWFFFDHHSSCALAQDVTVISSSPTTAPMPRKPYAPIENLLPAVRVKILIDQAVDIASQLNYHQSRSEPAETFKALLAQLQSLLLEPRSFFTTKEEDSSSQRYLEIDTLADWTNARRKEAQEQQNYWWGGKQQPSGGKGGTTSPPMFLPTKLTEELERFGELRQFERLQRQQIQLERSNPMRAALNAYTNNLIFGDSYVLTASKEERSRLIREERLPDVTSVIRSDLDLRDLYRNQILSYMDEARAELRYQLVQETFDGKELETLLREAKANCDKWFEFVPSADVQEAIQRLQSNNF